jgi:uncharacterized protein (DUF488 family)
MPLKTIYTIGHSNRAIEDFIAMLKSFNIALLADIRRFPASRKFPQFNKDTLTRSLQDSGIEYVHIEALGGRRPAHKDSVNTAWRLPAFRGYADYMQTDAFKEGADYLQKLASEKLTAYMCSEAVWWSCHRSLVSDYLKVRGWEVLHIMDIGKAKEHPYTGAAHIVDGKLSYRGDDLFGQATS